MTFPLFVLIFSVLVLLLQVYLQIERNRRDQEDRRRERDTVLRQTQFGETPSPCPKEQP